ncbi:MAG: hypothetical protein BGO31_05625 [Bacteroidetes bacterium 43-16]|nr:MAG: hypothetical protein BGO31_05625 [Bacteroidetes bacterium 43-16]
MYRNSKFLNYALLLVFLAAHVFLLFPFEHIVNKVLMTGLCLLGCLVLHAWSKSLGHLYTWLLALQFSVLYPIMAVYGKVNTDFLLSFYYSNFKESTSYLGIVPLKVWLIVALNLFLAVLVGRRHFRLFTATSRPRALLLTALFIVITSGLTLRMLVLTRFEFTREGNYSYLSYLPLSKTGLDLYSKFNNVALYRDNRDSMRAQLNVNPYTFDRLDLDKEIYMIVVGESVSKDYMNAYGYAAAENTPFISQSPNIQFDHYIAPASNTIRSLMEILSFKDKEGKPGSIFALLRSVKELKTIWISGQERVGWKDNPVSIISSLADTQVFLPDTRLNLASDRQAFELFREINDRQQYKVVFLHLYGSHPNACDRTGGVYSTFVQNQDLSCYLESIRQTDLLLQDIHTYLQQHYKKYKLLFFSDHGLSTDGSRMVHGYQPASYRVPLNIWDDTCTRKTFLTPLRSGFDFKVLWPEFFGVHTTRLHSDYRFISGEKMPHELYIYDENNRKAAWQP